MMKFFRKYMKHMLAVFMAALLVVWLGGSALTSFLQPDPAYLDETRGIAYGRTITNRDMQPTFNQLDILERLGLNWQVVWRYPFIALLTGSMDRIPPQAFRMLNLPPEFDQIRQEALTEEEWYMLILAADESGTYVSDTAVENFKQRWQIPESYLYQMRDRANISLDTINNAIRNFIKVHQAALQACEAAKISEADIQNFIRKTNQEIKVSVVPIRAQQLVDNSYQPTESELREHFEQYKDEPARQGDSLDFGYQLPEKVQVEYIEIDVDELAKQQTITDKEALDYWKTHQDEFTKMVTTTTTDTQPTTQKKREPYSTFSEAKPEVIREMAQQEAENEALRIARDIIGRLSEPWKTATTTGSFDYPVPPESEKTAGVYPNLIDKIQRQYSGVLSFTRTPLLEQKELRRQPGIGSAQAMQGTQQQISFAEAAFLVAGLAETPEDQPDYQRYFRNIYETCDVPFRDRQNNVYVFRTVGSEPQRAPESWEEVKDMLIQDIRLKKAYQQAEEVATQLNKAAEEKGLADALDDQMKDKLGMRKPIEPPPFSRQRMMPTRMGPRMMPGMIRGVGSDPQLVDECFDLLKTEETHPVKKIEQRSRQRWLVVQLEEKLPVTESQYKEQRSMAINYQQNQRQMDVLDAWFSADQIRARVQWEAVEPKVEKPEDAEQNEATQEPAEDEEAA
jgi:hypothetical protein